MSTDIKQRQRRNSVPWSALAVGAGLAILVAIPINLLIRAIFLAAFDISDDFEPLASFATLFAPTIAGIMFAALGFGTLPVCIAKTQASLSDNPKAYGAPSGFTLTVTDAALAAGAGFVVVIAGNMMRMPGLGKVPQAINLDVTDDGEIVGLR